MQHIVPSVRILIDLLSKINQHSRWGKISQLCIVKGEMLNVLLTKWNFYRKTLKIDGIFNVEVFVTKNRNCRHIFTAAQQKYGGNTNAMLTAESSRCGRGTADPLNRNSAWMRTEMFRSRTPPFLWESLMLRCQCRRHYYLSLDAVWVASVSLSLPSSEATAAAAAAAASLYSSMDERPWSCVTSS